MSGFRCQACERASRSTYCGVKFLVDAQLPRRLASWLQERGHDTIHTEELLQRNCTPDSLLLTKANEEQRVLISKDADFQMSFELGKGPPKLLLVTTGNIHNTELIRLFTRNEVAIFHLLEQHSFVELNCMQIIVHR